MFNLFFPVCFVLTAFLSRIYASMFSLRRAYALATTSNLHCCEYLYFGVGITLQLHSQRVSLQWPLDPTVLSLFGTVFHEFVGAH